jgi:hypothetical protein
MVANWVLGSRFKGSKGLGSEVPGSGFRGSTEKKIKINYNNQKSNYKQITMTKFQNSKPSGMEKFSHWILEFS